MKKSTNPLRLLNRQIYMSIVAFYLNLLTYFYLAFYTTFLPNIIMYGYQFRFITIYNIYIEQLLKKINFLAEFQELNFFLEAFRSIIETRSKFADNVK